MAELVERLRHAQGRLVTSRNKKQRHSNSPTLPNSPNAMHVYSARLELQLPSRTLKEKRSIIRQLKARLPQRFNVAVAEVDLHDAVAAATLGVATVSSDASYAVGLLERLAPWIERERPDVMVIAVEIEGW